jgi:DNA-directed RNA polymerase specialized sigma24 family protein
LEKEFTGLIDAWIAGVYRFHLARRGDWLDAETLTAQTFLDAYLSGTGDPAGLMRLALLRQARHRSGTNPGNISAVDGETDQDRLFQRARITALQDYWIELDPTQADAVSLGCFAGLDLATIAHTLFAPLSQVNTWLDSEAQVAVQLAGLGAVTPVPDGYKAELIAALSQISTPGWEQRQLEQASQQLKWLTKFAQA